MIKLISDETKIVLLCKWIIKFFIQISNDKTVFLIKQKFNQKAIKIFKTSKTVVKSFA